MSLGIFLRIGIVFVITLNLLWQLFYWHWTNIHLCNLPSIKQTEWPSGHTVELQASIQKGRAQYQWRIIRRPPSAFVHIWDPSWKWSRWTKSFFLIIWAAPAAVEGPPRPARTTPASWLTRSTSSANRRHLRREEPMVHLSKTFLGVTDKATSFLVDPEFHWTMFPLWPDWAIF